MKPNHCENTALGWQVPKNGTFKLPNICPLSGNKRAARIGRLHRLPRSLFTKVNTGR